MHAVNGQLSASFKIMISTYFRKYLLSKLPWSLISKVVFWADIYT